MLPKLSYNTFLAVVFMSSEACSNSPHEEMLGIVSVGLMTMSYTVELIVQSALFPNVQFSYRRTKTMPLHMCNLCD